MHIDIKIFEEFLSKLIIDKSFFHIKSIEFDLKGDLNPTNDLNELFFTKKNYLGFREFFSHYCHKHKDSLISMINKYGRDIFLKGLEARLYRTQFGFLTEYHAYYKCCNVFPTGSVLRNKEIDKLGVDFVITHNETNYNIHVFVDTERAWYYRNFKSNNKFVDSLPGIHVNFPYSLGNGKINSVQYLSNGFGIYTDEYTNYLKNEIIESKIIGKKIVGVGNFGFIYEDILSI